MIDAWISRFANPSPAALDAVKGLDPVVVVTGGSRGIGLALARRFARAGHNVALVARTAAKLEKAAAAIAAEYPVKAFAIVLDVTDPRAAQLLDEHLAVKHCYCDVLINNAGIGAAGPFEAEDGKRLMQTVELNIAALTRLMHHVLPGMIARGRGGILNVGSLGGLVPGPFQSAYYASKAYVVSLTEAVAWEARGQGVRLTVLAPGPVDTGFHADMGAEHAFYRQFILGMSAETVANSAYRGYILGFRLVVPGLMNKVLAVAVRVLPHSFLLPLLSWLLQPIPDREWSAARDAKD
jgi:short-subunit dehydrogenase